MVHFAATEAQGELNLVAFFEEAAGRFHLGVEVMVVNHRAKFDFLQLNDLLFLAGFGSLLLFLETELAVVENLGNRGLGVR